MGWLVLRRGIIVTDVYSLWRGDSGRARDWQLWRKLTLNPLVEMPGLTWTRSIAAETLRPSCEIDYGTLKDRFQWASHWTFGSETNHSACPVTFGFCARSVFPFATVCDAHLGAPVTITCTGAIQINVRVVSLQKILGIFYVAKSNKSKLPGGLFKW